MIGGDLDSELYIGVGNIVIDVNYSSFGIVGRSGCLETAGGDRARLIV